LAFKLYLSLFIKLSFKNFSLSFLTLSQQDIIATRYTR